MEKYGLVGEKLGHSLSEVIHNYIFKKENIDANYSLYEIANQSSNEIINIMKEKNISGFNITIPYKEKIISQLDFITQEAEKIGAVNTVIFKNGKSYGYNTDYHGVIKIFENANIRVKDRSCYILGSGGAAKSVIVALKNLEAKEIVVVTRDVKKNSKDIKNRFGKIEVISYEDIIGGDILINTTPVGMYPDINSIPIDESIIKRFDYVVDVIYNPLKTKFLTLAEKNGIKTAGGLSMLIEQGIKAEEIWQNKILKDELSHELEKILKTKLRGDKK